VRDDGGRDVRELHRVVVPRLEHRTVGPAK
jgi:hypothetical protein